MTRSPSPEVGLRAVEHRVRDYVVARRLVARGQRVLLLLSGGADSMALLALLRCCDAELGLGLTFGGLHVDYGVRGADSDRDREIVAAACTAAGMPLETVRPEGPLAGPDFQERARRLRYDAARRLVMSGGYAVAATGHNLDDQAETVLYRLAKYGAPSALTGMPVRSGDIVRPLLCLRAVEIREYCRARGIAYGDDYTNARETYARNVVRLAVLPQLERVNPRAATALAAAAELAAEQQELLRGLADEAWGRVAADDWTIDLPALEREPAPLQALLLRRLVLRALGEQSLLKRRLTEHLMVLAAGRDGTCRLRLSSAWEAVREYDRLAVRPVAVPDRAGGREGVSSAADAPRSAPDAEIPHGLPQTATDATSPAPGVLPVEVALPAPGGVPIAVVAGGRRLLVEQRAGRPRDCTGRLVLGSREPRGALTLRAPAAGDRFTPLGLGGETTVARFLREQKVPRALRARALLVAMDGRVAWVEVPGAAAAMPHDLAGRVAQSFRVTESSSFTVTVREQPAPREQEPSGRP